MKIFLYSTKVFIVFSLMLLLTIIAGCGSGSVQVDAAGGAPGPIGSSAEGIPVATGTSAGSGKGILSWDAPLLYSDGSTMAPGDIKEHRVYFGTSSGSYSAGSYYAVAAPATSVNIRELNLPRQRYYFVVTAVDTSDRESDFSGEVTADLGNFY